MQPTRKPRYCLQCDDGTVLELGVRDVTVTEGAVSRIAPDIAGWHCPKCGEIEFIDEDSSTRHMAVLDAVFEEVNADKNSFIRQIRKKLGLRQAEAGQLLGGGVSAFSDYERGKRQPHKAVVLLLKLLNRHPELLNEVRAVA
ncbi:antitoxin [Betaproteobacteria bacterium]|nr:antitoxin [Betaproteobacteria bacterium]GHU46032.1 antitoxin [Betaproteobacteria bacterium]